MQHTFNIGRNGSQTDMQLAFLKTYLKNNSKPKLIIHNLDLYSFQTSEEIYDPVQYMPYLDQTPIYEAIRRIYKYRDNNPNGDIAELVEVCKQQDIPLLLVYSPEYYEMQALERNRREVFARVREICDQFSVPLWDYSDSPIFPNRAYFYNSQHLNADGAKIFPTDLARRLIETGIVRNR